jgi:iron complex outermembrane receptor protein
LRRHLVTVCFLIVGCLLTTHAQGGGVISGKVVDSAGAAIADAAVSLTDLATQKVVRTTTGQNGQYTVSGLPSDPQLVLIEKSGFQSFTQRVSLATQASVTVNATLTVATLEESVVVRGTVVPEAEPMPTREDVMMSDQTLRVLDRKQLDAAGPVAGGAQMIQSTPGANVVGYGETGATKYTILLNGIQQGWAGEATSFTAPGSLGITYDGIPVVDPATGLWQSATVPQNLLMQNLDVTYGPGTADTRWYSDVGGRVEFTPIQPTETIHASLETTYGQFNQRNIAFVLSTGSYHGWSTVVGGGVGDGEDFRVAPDGFANSTRDGSAYGKTVKSFAAGSFAFGAYYAKGGGYRPTVIPTTDQGVIEPNGAHFSQATTGFYSALPFAAYNKYDTNELAMVYGREHLLLSDTTTLQNSTWFVHIRRLHRRNNDFLPSSGGTGQVDEYNNPHSNVFGDDLSLSKVFPLNTATIGGYLLHEIYNSHNNFFDYSQGGNGSIGLANIGGKIRSGYFQQDDFSFVAQDDFHPIPQIHITPSLREVAFSTSYSDQAARDFTFTPGVVLRTHCSLYPIPPSGDTPAQGQQIDPYFDLFGVPNLNDQGSLCGAHESRSKVEPGVNAAVMPFPWLTIYGGYDVTYRSPALGGGGGMFQSVDPNFYTLAKGAYTQGGVKVHFQNAPVLKNFILGVNYFHLDYTNQEIDFETASGLEISGGGNSTYHGVDAFFDDDPFSNVHIFFNFAGEAADFSNYIVGGPSLAECTAQGLTCTSYNNLPVSYVPNVTLNAGLYYGFQHNGRVLVEPRFWIEYIGSQHLWSNLSGAPSTQTMPSYTTANLSFTVPLRIHEQHSVNLTFDVMNLFNSQYNEWEYISSGGYFGTATNGYINAYPGAPRTVYGTISYQF